MAAAAAAAAEAAAAAVAVAAEAVAESQAMAAEEAHSSAMGMGQYHHGSTVTAGMRALGERVLGGGGHGGQGGYTHGHHGSGHHGSMLAMGGDEEVEDDGRSSVAKSRGGGDRDDTESDKESEISEGGAGMGPGSSAANRSIAGLAHHVATSSRASVGSRKSVDGNSLSGQAGGRRAGSEYSNNDRTMSGELVGATGTPPPPLPPLPPSVGQGTSAAGDAAAAGGGGDKDSESESGGDRSGTWGTGGMATKLIAAQIATACGATYHIIASDRVTRVPEAVAHRRRVGTTFLPCARPIKGQKRWILSLQAQGRLVMDMGASGAVIRNRKSLFAAGVMSVEGDFSAHEAVLLVDPRGHELAQAMVNYSRAEVDKIRGADSKDIPGLLGYEGTDMVCHRDNIVVLGERASTLEEEGEGSGEPPLGGTTPVGQDEMKAA